MPELPEVETVVQTLKVKILNQKLIKLVSRKPETVVLMEPFKAFTITAIERRGKYIIICGPHAEKIIIHLRMTGRITESPTNPQFVRATLYTDKHILQFEDMRRFGRIIFTKNDNIKDLPGIKNLGAEPWDDSLDRVFPKQLKASSKNIKSFLLDQSKIAGIGNIYADESCYHARILPTRKAHSLTTKEAKRLLYSIRYILTKAIYLRGTTFAHFIDADGKKGGNLEYLAVYGRKKKPCFHCGNELTTKKLQGRTTVYCSYCQQ